MLTSKKTRPSPRNQYLSKVSPTYKYQNPRSNTENNSKFEFKQKLCREESKNGNNIEEHEGFLQAKEEQHYGRHHQTKILKFNQKPISQTHRYLRFPYHPTPRPDFSWRFPRSQRSLSFPVYFFFNGYLYKLNIIVILGNRWFWWARASVKAIWYEHGIRTMPWDNAVGSLGKSSKVGTKPSYRNWKSFERWESEVRMFIWWSCLVN